MPWGAVAGRKKEPSPGRCWTPVLRRVVLGEAFTWGMAVAGARYGGRW